MKKTVSIFALESRPSSLVELARLTADILDIERIGRPTAQIGDAFGVKILASSRNLSDPPPLHSFHWVDTDSLLSESDVLSLHVSHSGKSRNHQQRTATQNAAYCIPDQHFAGLLLVGSDLTEALKTGQTAGAARIRITRCYLRKIAS